MEPGQVLRAYHVPRRPDGWDSMRDDRVVLTEVQWPPRWLARSLEVERLEKMGCRLLPGRLELCPTVAQWLMTIWLTSGAWQNLTTNKGFQKAVKKVHGKDSQLRAGIRCGSSPS